MPKTELNPVSNACVFCKSSEDDQKLGGLRSTKSMRAHHFCLLFSTHIRQSGKDTSGIFGFLQTDIRQELRRTENVKCSYCNQPHASVYCAEKRCKRVFHLPCGLAKNSSHEFFQDFKSYCHSHRRAQKIASYLKRALTQLTCIICAVEFTLIDYDNVFWPECCSPQGLIHKQCVQRYVSLAGYYSKCPTCNSHTRFILCCQRYGIFVPERDASWETEPGAYADLYVSNVKTCSEVPCLCPKGRSYNQTKSPWIILRCSTCGSVGSHRACIKTGARSFTCVDCTKICLRLEAEANASEDSETDMLQSTVVSSATCSDEFKGVYKLQPISNFMIENIQEVPEIQSENFDIFESDVKNEDSNLPEGHFEMIKALKPKNLESATSQLSEYFTNQYKSNLESAQSSSPDGGEVVKEILFDIIENIPVSASQSVPKLNTATESGTNQTKILKESTFSNSKAMDSAFQKNPDEPIPNVPFYFKMGYKKYMAEDFKRKKAQKKIEELNISSQKRKHLKKIKHSKLPQTIVPGSNVANVQSESSSSLPSDKAPTFYKSKNKDTVKRAKELPLKLVKLNDKTVEKMRSHIVSLSSMDYIGELELTSPTISVTDFPTGSLLIVGGQNFIITSAWPEEEFRNRNAISLLESPKNKQNEDAEDSVSDNEIKQKDENEKGTSDDQKSPTSSKKIRTD